MDVLVDTLAMSHQSRRNGVNSHLQVGNGSFAHLLLMSNRGDCEFATLVLNDGEGGNFGILGVRFAIDSVSAKDVN